VRVHSHAALAAAAGDHLVDVGSGQRFPVVHSQPQLRPGAAGCLVADLDDAVLAALASNGDESLTEADRLEPLPAGWRSFQRTPYSPDQGRPELRPKGANERPRSLPRSGKAPGRSHDSWGL
jgi:hypothetical protein